ncbi:unnamed protein product [Ectocarpus sp. 8 AP-2014]
MERVRAVLYSQDTRFICWRSFISVCFFFLFILEFVFLLPLGELSPAVYCSHLCDLSST